MTYDIFVIYDNDLKNIYIKKIATLKAVTDVLSLIRLRTANFRRRDLKCKHRQKAAAGATS